MKKIKVLKYEDGLYKPHTFSITVFLNEIHINYNLTIEISNMIKEVEIKEIINLEDGVENIYETQCKEIRGDLIKIIKEMESKKNIKNEIEKWKEKIKEEIYFEKIEEISEKYHILTTLCEEKVTFIGEESQKLIYTRFDINYFKGVFPLTSFFGDIKLNIKKYEKK